MVNTSGILAIAKNLSQIVLYHVPLRPLRESFLFYSIYFSFIYFAVPGLSCGTQDLNCSMRDLVPLPGIEPRPTALEAWSLNH